MSTAYRLLYTNLLTGAVLGELPVLTVGTTLALNAPGSIRATLALDDSYKVEAPDGLGGSATLVTPQRVNLDVMEPGSVGLYLERDGVLLWGGVLWTANLDVAGRTIDIGGEGFLSYLRRTFILEALTYQDEDQIDIVDELVGYARSKPGAVPILFHESGSPVVLRTRTYAEADRLSVGEAVENLAAVIGGFDFRFSHAFTVGEDGIQTTFEYEGDTIGRMTNHVFELGVNVELLGLSVDATNRAHYVEAWGQSSEARLRAVAFDGSTSRPRLERIDNYTDVKEYNTLVSKAERTLVQVSQPTKRLSLSVDPSAVPVLGSYEVGDRVTVRGSFGALSVSGFWRIMSMALDIDDAGSEKVTLNLVPQEVFA